MHDDAELNVKFVIGWFEFLRICIEEKFLDVIENATVKRLEIDHFDLQE